MVTVNLTIPDNKVSRVIDALKGLYPIPTTTDEETGENTPDFTDAEWGKECLRRWLIRQVKRYEEMKAKNAIDITLDNDLVE